MPARVSEKDKKKYVKANLIKVDAKDSEVKAFLNKANPETYDFKWELIKIDNHYANICDPIDRFIVYRQDASGFDCDCCRLTMKIQVLLYRQFGAKGYYERYLYFDGGCGNDWIRETDTINSFQSRLTVYRKNKSEQNLSQNKDLKEFARLTHTIGNFMIGPYGFNARKGRSGNGETCDRMDTYLDSEKCSPVDKLFLRIHEKDLFMEKYFIEDDSPYPLNNLSEVNQRIEDRGIAIVKKLKRNI